MKNSFLLLRLRGKRFSAGSLPLAFLPDLSAVEELLIEAAKHRFLVENPSRERVPRGFRDGVQFRLTEISEGSTTAAIDLAPEPARLPFGPHRFQEYFDIAREDILTTIGNGHATETRECRLNRQSLLYFNQVGRGLHDDESMEFENPTTNRKAELNRRKRRELVLIAEGSTLTEEVSLRGAISEMDQERMTLTLRQIHGGQLAGPFPETHFDTVLDAFRHYRLGQLVVLDAVGRYDRNRRLKGWDAIRHVSLLDPLDIRARLDEFRRLRDGWYGENALAPPAGGLDWFGAAFETHYPADLPLPWVYPTQQGGVVAEWELGAYKLSLEVDLEAKTAEWHWFSEENGENSLQDVDLSEPESWERIVADLKEFGPSGE